MDDTLVFIAVLPGDGSPRRVFRGKLPSLGGCELRIRFHNGHMAKSVMLVPSTLSATDLPSGDPEGRTGAQTTGRGSNHDGALAPTAKGGS